MDKVDYQKIFKHRRYDMLFGEEDTNDQVANDEEGDKAEKRDTKTPFETLREKMEDITPNKDGGVVKRILTPGYGVKVPVAARVRIHYNAYFEMNDEPFDSTYLRSKSFEFKLGDGSVVLGLDMAVASMKKNEKAQFIFEPEYYIGQRGCAPRVPPSTAGKFDLPIQTHIKILQNFFCTAKIKLSLKY
jgi:FKBP-type peptidyl-prolyl cis-trans isomerase